MASKALARRALFDLSPRVREAAILSLNQRSRSEYRDVLLTGVRYPWGPVVDHAVEALVALQDTDAVPGLLLSLEHISDEIQASRKSTTRSIRELVRVNHLRNCRLCHAPSKDLDDPVRGLVPDPKRPPPPPTKYYGGEDGIFVRADVTYLKQDFSVAQSVANPGPWPSVQRYDYLVRTNPGTGNDADQARANHQKQAILDALRVLDPIR